MSHLSRRLHLALLTGSLLAAALPLHAQDAAPRRGRKYKAPPETSHIEVLVTRTSNGKPIVNAAVIFRATRDGKDDGNLEVKTDPDGKATIDVIQTGSKVQVQVFANGYATFADSYQVDQASREIHVGLERPREQVSAYVDNTGKASSRKAGVQEPEQAKPAPSATTLQPRPGPGGSAPAPASPPTATPPPTSTTTPPANSAKPSTSPSSSDATPPASTPPRVPNVSPFMTEVSTDTSPLAGKTALITGAAKRIGRAIALDLAHAGADICITYRSSASEAEATVLAIKALGVRAFALECDLTNPAAIAPMVALATEHLGRLDLLVNNAGSFASEPMEAISVADWDAMFAINTRAPFLVAQALLPALRASRGRIINLGSLGGLHPWATHAHYCTSKAALHMLSQTMAKAWAPDISVNCVAPGMIVQGEVDATYEHLAQKTPMRRNGTADDVAAAVRFFATGPHFITGQLLAVDGGLGL